MGKATPPTDQRLVDDARRAADGDFRAFETLVRRHQRRVLANCRYLSRSPTEAEDLAQEVFMKAFFGLPRFEGRSSFQTWIQRIKVNHCLNHIKKRGSAAFENIDQVVAETAEELSVAQAAESSGIDFAPSLGRLVSGLILFIVGIMAIGQLKIEFEIIRIVTSLLLAGLALAFGLSFGLGTRDLTRNILAGFYARKVLRIGEPLEIRGEHGTLKAITPTHTLIEDGRKTVSIANGTFLDEIARQDRPAEADG